MTTFLDATLFLLEHPSHMGMLILQNKWENVPEIEITERTMSFTTKKAQYSKLRISEIITIIFLYINKTPNMLEIEEIADILKMENASVVMGDFNIDPNKEDGAKKINLFSKITKMIQVNQEVTRKSTLSVQTVQNQKSKPKVIKHVHYKTIHISIILTKVSYN